MFGFFVLSLGRCGFSEAANSAFHIHN